MSDCNTDWGTVQKMIDQLSPAERLHLIEEVTKSLAQPLAADVNPRQLRANLDRLQRDLKAIPTRNPDDGFAGRDHDRILYGDKR